MTDDFEKIRLLIAYDGTPFSGWQIQEENETIQGHIEKALLRIIGNPIRVIGAGRTDAGVHARGQVAHFCSEKKIDISALKRALNALLPQEIRILDIAKAPKEFHAQISAIGKEYHYHLCLDEVPLPFDRPYVWHYRRRVDLPLLHKACELFVGEHDFRGFSNAIGGGVVKENTVRSLLQLSCMQTRIGLRLEFIGDGFLYKMVRNITGMLMAVSAHKRTLGDIEHILAAHDRREAEPGAPPQGLFLMNVFYRNNDETQSSEE